MFFRFVWGAADAVLFFRGRLYFRRIDGSRAKWTGGAPSVLVAYGTYNVKVLNGLKHLGQVVNL